MIPTASEPQAVVSVRQNIGGGGGSGWKNLYLQAINAPESNINIAVLHYWALSEGVPARAHNALASFLRLHPYHYERPYTCPFYATWEQGARSFRITLEQTPSAGYPPILRAFRQDLGGRAIADAIHNSKWCPGCAGYPVALYAAINAGHIHAGANPNSHPAPSSFPAPPPSETNHDYHAKVRHVGRENYHTGRHLAGGRRALAGLLGSRHLH